jgi:predicted DNA binding protein
VGTIAELSIPTTEFALRESLVAVPDTTLEVERVAAHSKGRFMPFIWVRTTDFNRFEAALREDPTVGEIERLSALESERLYRMDWVDPAHPVHVILNCDSTILSATGTDEHWRLRILFSDREALSAAHDRCCSSDLDFEITSIYELEGEHRGQYSLTTDQHETLVEGARRGYYNVPRDITLGEFAVSLGISHQALSERLRRGHRNLIESALLDAQQK